MSRSVARNAFFALVAAIALSACSGPTKYAPASDGGDGYAERQIEPNRYRVQFRGNSVTDRETVETYLLYRAAEITLDSGHDYFRVVDQQVTPETSYYDNRPGVGVHGSRGSSRGWGLGVGVSLGTVLQPSTSFDAVLNILVFKGQKPDGDEDAYDAREVIRLVGPSVKRPESS